ncbi:MAG TPA: cellulase family glycosylhydrolase [Polyangia bacterium]|nr:cellulase family glycosylhydrolase [Polyangia bacterium]
MTTRKALFLIVSLTAGACGSPVSTNGGSGGASASGGSRGTGGGTGTGGVQGTGGATSGTAGTRGSGGATATGGATGTGGVATGGSSGSGGVAGAKGTGGAGSGGTTDTTGTGGMAGAKGTGGATGTGGMAGATGTGGSGGAASGVHVVGNQIYDGATAIRLMGVNRPGGEYGCVSGNVWDPADGSGNNQATITAMLAWKINAVRIPLNEDCWLSLNGVKTGGATYQNTIQTWVNLLLQNNIYPILDLHWTENNGAEATGQQPMPDMAHAPTFWGQVAAAYKDSPRVIFDLFNEPYPDNNMEATAAWTCWRDGGTCSAISYPAAGMQAMLTAVRNAGANNLVLLGGIEYSNDLSQWLTYQPTDPAHNFAASWHVYPNSNYTSNHTLMMDAMGVAGMVPIVATEIGGVLDGSCTATSGTDSGSFITMAMSYLDGLSPPQSYVAWSWSTDDTPVLISSLNGTAACSGITYKAHLLATPH